jgi:hypothetical protein
MLHKLFFNLVFLSLIIGFPGCEKKTAFKIYLAESSDEREQLSARELRRYIYLRTDILVPIEEVNFEKNSPLTGIIIGLNNDRHLLSYLPDSLQNKFTNLHPEGYIIYADQKNNGSLGIIAGADPQGVLYGAYRFLEKLGCRFYLHGDVIPDRKMSLDLPKFLEIREPLFTIRGILPFHDFPEGPDWWDQEDYNQYISQIPKLQMNFIGFHTYPESGFPGAYKAEPLVWIGEEEQIMKGGSVSSAYPLLHFNTGDTTWGYLPKPTSQYSGGASLLFEKDRFGASYLPDLSPWPHTDPENTDLVNHFGSLLNESFSLANRLGVRTCIGTETPLTIPGKVYLDMQNKYPLADPDSLTRLLYRGIFQRIIQAHPLDYYWFWTPENWTWSAVSDAEVEDTRKDLQIAWEVANELQAPFTLATCGWVLGPPRDRTEFDELLPKHLPFSCINRYVGFSRIESAFNEISERPLWAIPWLEDDPGLLSPQLWAGRMRKDAYDAYQYGCNGLIGIHWRTRLIGPNLAALAEAGWDLDLDTFSGLDSRDLPVNDFYEDWALHQFGQEKGEEIAKLYASLDGGPEFFPENNQPYRAHLFRTSEWVNGPGAISLLREPWSEVKNRFSFVREMESLQEDIIGTGNRERFDYWLNTFRFARETARLGCLLGDMEKVSHSINAEKDKTILDSIAQYELLPLRIKAAETYNRLVNFLLMTVTNSSELGTVANLEQHNLLTLNRLSTYDSMLSEVLQEPLPSSTHLQMNYEGPPKLILQAPISLLEKDTDLYLKVRVLSRQKVKDVKLYWKELGERDFNNAGFRNIGRNVFEITLDKSSINNRDLEYYIEGILNNDEMIKYPATAGTLNQTVIIF